MIGDGQEQQAGRSLGGRPIYLPEAPGPQGQTQYDEIRLGEKLVQDIAGYLSRDEAPPAELEQALQGWQEQAMAYAGQSEGELSDAWVRAYSNVEVGVMRAVQDAEDRRTGTKREKETYWYGPAEVPKFEPEFKTLELPDSLRSAPAVVTDEMRRTNDIVTRPIIQDKSGAPFVVDNEGIAWDLSEALDLWNQPEVRKHLRESLMGMLPFEQEWMTHTVGAMGATGQLPVELAGKIGLSDERRNVRTAIPGFRLPWLVGVNPDGSFRGDEEELLMNPVYARALKETIDTLDVKPTGWETLGHALAGAADFMVFSRAAGMVGGAAKTALASATEGTQLGVGLDLVGTALGRHTSYTFPFNTSMAHTIPGFMGYELLTQATNPDTTMFGDLYSGFKQGFVFGVAGTLAKSARGLTTAAGKGIGIGLEKVSPKAYSLMARLVPPTIKRIAGAPEPGRLLNDRAIMARISDITGPVLSKAFKQEAHDPFLKDAIKHAVDAYMVGSIVNAYGHAAAANPEAPFRDFWSNMFTRTAAMNGFGFALAGSLQYGAGVRRQVNDWIKSETGQEAMKEIARSFAQPTAGPVMKDLHTRFEVMRAAEPELWEGVQFITPELSPPPKVPVTNLVEAYDAMEAREPARVGPATPENLEILGLTGKNNAGRLKHAVNAVNEYLRVNEGEKARKYKKWEDVPKSVFKRALAWREAGKPARGQELLDLEGKEPPTPPTPPEGPPPETPPEGPSAAPQTPSAPPGEGPASEAVAAHPEAPKPRPRRRRQPVSPKTIEQAAELNRQVGPEPAYKGLAAPEAIARAVELRRKRRLGMGTVIARFDAGKMTAEEVREMYPEAAHLVPDKPQKGWSGAFDRAARAAWKERRTVQARRNLDAINQDREQSIQGWLKARGGLEHLEDLADLADEGGSHPIVRKKGSRGGIPIDQAGEMLWDAGWFPERPSVNELQEAIRNNISHPEKAGRAALAQHEKDVAKMYGDQLVWEREQIEEGKAELPTDKAERQRMLKEIYEGDARFEGMDAAAIDREIAQLRAQAEAGDPGPVFAGPPDGPLEHAHRAARHAEQVFTELQGYRLIDLVAPIQSQEALDAFHRVLYGERPEVIPESEWSAMRRQTREMRGHTREALRKAMIGPWEAKDIERMEDVWSYVDAWEAGRDVPSELRARLKDHLDENGKLNPSFLNAMEREVANRMWDLAKAHDEVGDQGFNSFLSPFAFGSRKFTIPEEGKLRSLLSWNYWYDKPIVQKWLGQPHIKRIVDTFYGILSLPGLNVVNLGPISRPQSSFMRGLMSHWITAKGLSEGRLRDREILATTIVNKLYEATGGRVLTSSESAFFDRGLESGAFKNAKGPEDFERMRTGAGKLWNFYTQMRDVLEEYGRDLVRLGLMTREQLDKLGGGAYLSHEYIRDEKDTTAEELGRGEIPQRYLGRVLARTGGEPGPEDIAFRIADPVYRFLRTTKTEGQLLRSLSALENTYLHPAYWRNWTEMQDLMPADRADFQRAAMRVKPEKGETLFDALKRMRDNGDGPGEALLLGARLQALEQRMAKKGEEQKPGQFAYTPRMDNMLKFFLGEGPNGPVFIPKPIAQELEIAMSEMFTLPGENAAAKAMAKVDIGLSAMKRGYVVLRPAAWTLQFGSNALTNSALRAVPLNDFARGMAGLPSYTRDGIEGFVNLMRWYQELQPKTKPEGWTDKQWSSAQDARHFNDTAGPSSSIYATLSPEFVGALQRAMYGKEEAQNSLMGELERFAQQNNITTDARDRMEMMVMQKAKMFTRGLEGFDQKIGELLGSYDAQKQARGLAMMASIWHAADLFLFKYPAYLKMREEWPGVTYPKLLEASLSATSDMRDTSPWLRRFLSMHTPWNDKAWRSAHRNSTAKLLVAQLFRSRFWTYQATMIPKLLRAQVAYPVRAGMLATGVLGLSQLISRLIYSDEDERKRWEEEEAVAKWSLTHWRAPSDMEIRSIKELGLKAEPFMFGMRLPEGVQQVAADAWKRVKQHDPWAIPALSHGGRSRVQSLAELGPTGFLMNEAYRKGEIIGVGSQDPSERARSVSSGLFRLLGLQAQTLMGGWSGLATAKNTLADVLGGRKSATEALGSTVSGLAGAAGMMYPTVGLLSPENVYIGESVFLRGQDWREYARGVRTDRPEDPGGHELAAIAGRTLWPQRQVNQRRALGSPVDGWTQVLSEIYGRSFDPSNAEDRSMLAAHNWVTDQLSRLMGDLYEQYKKSQADPTGAQVDMNERMAGAIRETIERVVEVEPGRFAISPGEDPKSLLLRSAMDLPEDQRSEALGHLRRYLTASRFAEDGMNMIWAAGERAEMPVQLFREGIRNAMRDPSGVGLINWWWSQVEDGDIDRMGLLAPLMHDVQAPSEGKTHDTYVRILMKYRDAHIPIPAQVQSVEEALDRIYGEQGQTRALQGGKAFKNVLNQRPSGLDQLLLNQQ